jgi:hypothetical protein
LFRLRLNGLSSGIRVAAAIMPRQAWQQLNCLAGKALAASTRRRTDSSSATCACGFADLKAVLRLIELSTLRYSCWFTNCTAQAVSILTRSADNAFVQ